MGDYSDLIRDILLGGIIMVWLVSVYWFERNLSTTEWQTPIEPWANRFRFYKRWAIALLVLMTLYFIVFGGFSDTMEFVRDASFWGAMASIGLFLIILIVRYAVLMGLSYFAFRDEDSGDVPEIEDLDNASLPFISIIVPAYNEEMVIDASIASLLELDYPRYEVVVVDDGSSDRTFAAARAAAGLAPGRIRVLTQVNSGKAMALNHGIQQARGEFVFCMDADSRIAPLSLKAAIRHMLADVGVGAVAGAVKVANANSILTRLQGLEYLQGLNIVRQAQGWAHLVNIIPGPAGLFRKAAWRDAGGYDGDTFAEDCDLTIKLLMRGWRVKYEPKVQAVTEVPEKLGALFQQRYRWTRGIIQAVNKHSAVLRHPRGNWVNAFVLWYMLFETLMWPIMNLLANIMLLYIALGYGVSSILVLWWLLLTLLDVSITLLAVGMEDEDAAYIPYAVFYRLFFTLIIDVCKVFATIEEFLGVGMSWGKLTRLGRL